MSSPGPHRTLSAWIAMLAILWVGALPSLSHVVAAGTAGQDARIEVCTASGMAWVAASPASDPTEPASGPDDGSMASCHWCASHAPVAALVPGPSAGSAVPCSHLTSIPVTAPRTPRLSTPWFPLHSRAPPAIA